MDKKKAGRPSKYSTEIAEIICDEIATSSKGLKTICDSDNSLPTFKTVFNWLNDPAKPEFLQLYARAREGQADLLADEIIEISNTPSLGTKVVEKPTGTETTYADMIEHRRLQVEARKWKAAKLAPRKYGDKIDVTSKGDSIAPLIIYSRNDEEKKKIENLR